VCLDIYPPPPLPEACRHDNHGLRIASAARHWGGLGSCRCVCVCVCVMHLQVFFCAMVHGNNSCFLSHYLHLHWYLVCDEAEGCLEGWDGLAVFVWCYIKTERAVSVSVKGKVMCVSRWRQICVGKHWYYDVMVVFCVQVV